MALRTGNATMKTSRPQWLTARLINLVILILFGIMLTACASADSTPAATKGPAEQMPSSQATEAEPAAETKVPEDPNVIRNAWESSSHADAFVVSETGTNSTCARCHAPVNWIPTMDDMPESCFACKFEVDPPPPFIPETEWTDVECKVCHKTKKGKVEDEIAWLEIAPIEEYAEVSSVTELCDKCHLGDSIPEHAPVLVSGAHEGFQCTDCHNAHDTTATCSTSECHGDVLAASASIPGHDEEHVSVGCVACHDEGDMVIDVITETGVWSTYFFFDSVGEEKAKPFTSHDIVLEAPCERCHYATNPWGLAETVTAEGP